MVEEVGQIEKKERQNIFQQYLSSGSKTQVVYTSYTLRASSKTNFITYGYCVSSQILAQIANGSSSAVESSPLRISGSLHGRDISVFFSLFRQSTVVSSGRVHRFHSYR